MALNEGDERSELERRLTAAADKDGDPRYAAMLREAAERLGECRRALGRSLRTIAALTPLGGEGPWEELADHCDDVRREIRESLAKLEGGSEP